MSTFNVDDLSIKTGRAGVIGGWAWLTSVTLAVIGRLSKVWPTVPRNVCDKILSPTFYGIGDKYLRHIGKCGQAVKTAILLLMFIQMVSMATLVEM